MKLIRQKYNYHVSLDTVEEFEKIILSDKSVTSVNEKNKFFSKVLFQLWNKLTVKKNDNLSIKPKSEITKTPLFAILMGPDFSKCFPYFIFQKNTSLYLFDAWPEKQKIIIKFLNFFKVKNVFFTSSQTTEIIKSKVPNTNCYWIPEGILAESYKSYQYKDKTIDVLALGRRHNIYNEKIVNYLEENNKLYLYEKEKGKIIFPTRDGFIDGLAKSKISICVPSNITHPERSGNIETMTIRYLQSMASKCIILGHAPKEMITLFGYNPVIEIDYNDPENQILSILNNYEDYYSLIEKNYNTLLKNHTWTNRWETMKEILNKNVPS